jgi:hypothetical protein
MTPELGKIFYELGLRRGLASLAKYLQDQVSLGRLSKLDPLVAARHFMGLLTAEIIVRCEHRWESVRNPQRAKGSAKRELRWSSFFVDINPAEISATES